MSLEMDAILAASLEGVLNCTGVTENAIFPEEKDKQFYRPKTLIDESLEYLDPTPNIHTLFIQFNKRFFWNALLPVEVKWSPRMTSCAGICTFHPRNRHCIISLSTPLLKLRPRKDLVETLLHEMIHAYLFLINDNRDRDGHGPIFQSHMRRINQAAGTNITIYHTFHEEVRLYKQHWWRCNGPCQSRSPFFGVVKRAMNRAPGPNDLWWAEHQLTCGGQFIKTKEPEKKSKARPVSNGESSKENSKKTSNNSILSWVKSADSNGNMKGNNKTEPTNKPFTSNAVNHKNPSNSNFQTDLKKLGNSSNNIHGWGTGGPSATSNSFSDKFNNKVSRPNSSSKSPQLSFSGTLGGGETGRSILLEKFPQTKSNKSFSKDQVPKTKSTSSYTEDILSVIVECPICKKMVKESEINQHIDICIENPEIATSTQTSNEKRKSTKDHLSGNKKFKNDNDSEHLSCPLCSKKLKFDDFNTHLDKCAEDSLSNEEESLNSSCSSSVNLQDSPHICLICNKKLEEGISLKDHLEDCMASIFDDSKSDEIELLDTKSEKKTPAEEDLKLLACPVCMELVPETNMNTHLDGCIKM